MGGSGRAAPTIVLDSTRAQGLVDVFPPLAGSVSAAIRELSAREIAGRPPHTRNDQAIGQDAVLNELRGIDDTHARRGQRPLTGTSKLAKLATLPVTFKAPKFGTFPDASALTGRPSAMMVGALGALAEDGHEPGAATALSAERRAGGWSADAEVGGPYVTAVSVTAEPETNDQTPAASHAPWIKPIGDYERKQTTTVEGLRYG
jgi:hypothetical protein